MEAKLLITVLCKLIYIVQSLHYRELQYFSVNVVEDFVNPLGLMNHALGAAVLQ
jgi:hypothetical protein